MESSRTFNRTVLCVLLAAGILAVSCAPGAASAPAVETPVDQSWNHTARLMAGLPPKADSPYASVAKSKAFTNHQAAMDRFWSAVEKNSLKPMSEWRKTQLAGIDGTRPAVYPLSGADFVNLYALYPAASEYVMFALEEPGQPPKTLTTELKALGRILGSLRSVIGTIASKNYFYSANMRTYLKHTPMKGTAPPLMAFIARLNLDLRSVEPIFITAEGKLSECPQEACPQGSYQGIRYRFRAAGDKQDRDLVYLSIRLEKDTLEPTTATGRYLNSLPVFNSMLKSAIYLLHSDTYAGSRDWMLQKSAVVVQDDSGIPYRFFANERYNVRLFGRYMVYRLSIGGIGKPPRQKDLEQLYQQPGVTPLSFRFGYGGLAGTQNSTMMIAEKKNR